MNFLLLVSLFLAAQQTAPFISAPVSGETLRGMVEIVGTTDMPGFASAQLDFAYASSPAEAWFALQALSQPAADSVLARWDTTLISDGDYRLRLRVFLADGSFQDVTVNDLHVRNYTPDAPTPTAKAAFTMEAALPAPTSILPAVTQASILSPRFTPTPLPPNPVSISVDEIYFSVRRGILIILGAFILFGLFLRLRRA